MLEASARTGGLVRTLEHDGFRFEEGPEALPGNARNVRALCQELGLAVQPLHRRKGIGEALLRAAKVQAREEGFQALSLSVAAHNRSRMMYQRSGFEKVAEEGDSWTMVANL